MQLTLQIVDNTKVVTEKALNLEYFWQLQQNLYLTNQSDSIFVDCLVSMVSSLTYISLRDYD